MIHSGPFTRLCGTGGYVPDTVVTNHDFAARLDTSDAWIRERTGIRERRVMAAGEVTSDMVAAAAREALAAAELAAADIDCLVVATTTPDMPMPSCAAVAQAKLGLSCPAFDVNAACAGFNYGLAVVDGFIRGGVFSRVLLVGADALSRFVDPDDRSTAVLFGDGAGAVVAIAESPRPEGPPRGILASRICADGTFAGSLSIPGGGAAHPPRAAGDDQALQMNGRVVFSHAVKNLAEVSAAVLDAAGMSVADVDVIVPHQANLRILDALAQRLRIDTSKFVVNLDRLGNTSAASIPLALDQGVRSGQISAGNTVLMCSIGAGFTWGAAVARW